ncbi:MAG TPA: hypothetical protein VIY49_29995 [Bryobacteraceae bacterium]
MKKPKREAAAKHKREAATKQAARARLAAIRHKVAGIDIGSRQMYVCGPAGEDGTHEIRTYATTTERACGRWLREQQVDVDIGQQAYERLYEAVRLRTVTSTAAQLGYRLVKTEA